MNLDIDKIDEMILALLYLTTFEDHGIIRAWKSHDWEALNRLFEKGLIGDPKSKSKSVLLSKEGANFSKELFYKHFVKNK
jgi:hypothetical protein